MNKPSRSQHVVETKKLALDHVKIDYYSGMAHSSYRKNLLVTLYILLNKRIEVDSNRKLNLSSKSRSMSYILVANSDSMLISSMRTLFFSCLLYIWKLSFRILNSENRLYGPLLFMLDLRWFDKYKQSDALALKTSATAFRNNEQLDQLHFGLWFKRIIKWKQNKHYKTLEMALP